MSNILRSIKTEKQTEKNYKRRVENGRLAYFEITADEAFWDRHWQENYSDKLYKQAEKGNVNQFESYFTRYLPKGEPVIEAGCGLGQYVLALGRKGYSVEGVEWGRETVAFAKKRYSDLAVRVGDVTNLEVPDCYYGAYISLGVWEHRKEGPDPFIKEAYRVLRPGGIGLISVPYYNPLRRLKAYFGFYRDDVQGLEFYQYAYSIEEFRQFLEQGGFTIVDQTVMNPYKGITDEIFVLRWFARWRPLRLLIQAVFLLPIFRPLGHKMLFVCRKNG